MTRREPWIGVDLDGTLAEYQHSEVWDGSVGNPIAGMVERVKAWRAQGVLVKIFTARVAPFFEDDARSVDTQRKIVEAWCLEHLGEVLPVTATKDYDMILLYDDRAIRIQQNAGYPCTACLAAHGHFVRA